MDLEQCTPEMLQAIDAYVVWRNKERKKAADKAKREAERRRGSRGGG